MTRKKEIILLLFIFCIGLNFSFARKKNDRVEDNLEYPKKNKVINYFFGDFIYKKDNFSFKVKKTKQGNSLILYKNKVKYKDLSKKGFYNLYPEVFILDSGDVNIIWQSKKDKKTFLTLYSLKKDLFTAIKIEDFMFARPLALVKNIHKEKLLLFKGNNSNNAELFLYNFKTSKVINISNTPYSEFDFEVIKESDGLKVKSKSIKECREYFIDIDNLNYDFTLIQKGNKVAPLDLGYERRNIIVGFGDSIIWGKMRMDNLEGEHHPSLTFMGQLVSDFCENYGEVGSVNLGLPGDNTYGAASRVEEAFSDVNGEFALIMYGTNDIRPGFDCNSSIENMRFVIEKIKSYGYYVIVSTIPPQRYYSSEILCTEETKLYNESLMRLCEKLKVVCVNPYPLFMNYPGGTLALLEDTKGNHPSPLGHSLIAKLIKPEILKLPPDSVKNIKLYENSHYSKRFNWQRTLAFDFDFYQIIYGSDKDNMKMIFKTKDNFISFNSNWVFNKRLKRKIFFKIISVDKSGNKSKESPIYNVKY